jgi:hypothetical protein
MESDSRLISLIALSIMLITVPDDANAYIDPGTGGYFFQILFATILGAIFGFLNLLKRLYFYVRNIFRGKNTNVGDQN